MLAIFLLLNFASYFCTFGFLVCVHSLSKKCVSSTFKMFWCQKFFLFHFPDGNTYLARISHQWNELVCSMISVFDIPRFLCVHVFVSCMHLDKKNKKCYLREWKKKLPKGILINHSFTKQTNFKYPFYKIPTSSSFSSQLFY